MPFEPVSHVMKFLPIVTACIALLALTACATPDDERRHGAPPPGSHSPFAHPDRADPAGQDRDQPERREERPDDEDEPEEPEPER